MKQMSFALTTAQVRARTKTVTRRLGWQTAKVGQLVQPIVKGQGLKKGQHVEPIGGPIRFTSVRLEPLSRVTFADCAKEGFHGMEPCEFVEMFSRHNGCQPDDIVTRIEFQYLGASPGASRWQPIETAPKDREILVYDEGVILITLWMEDETLGTGWWDHGLMVPAPTHWMPLPPAPSEEKS